MSTTVTRTTPSHRDRIDESRLILETLRVPYIRERTVVNTLKRLNPFVFEELILSALEYVGYEVIRNRSYSGDGGVDGRVVIDGTVYLIQCKRIKAHVSSEHIEEFTRLCIFTKSKGLFVHTGKESMNARSYQQSGEVTLVSGYQLACLVAGFRPTLKPFERQLSFLQWIRESFGNKPCTGANHG